MLRSKNDPWGDNESRWKDPVYLQWLKEIWHVFIQEEPRHLWPGQWTIHGYWQDEKDLYTKYEKEWDNRRQEVWDKKHPALLETALLFQQEGEDYFNWNVETPGWSMHRNGSWQKMLIDMDDWQGKTRDQYPGIFTSYEHACKTLGNYCDLVAPRFALGELTDYEKHLKDFVDNYNYA
jgi:hypothetical protein